MILLLRFVYKGYYKKFYSSIKHTKGILVLNTQKGISLPEDFVTLTRSTDLIKRKGVRGYSKGLPRPYFPYGSLLL